MENAKGYGRKPANTAEFKAPELGARETLVSLTNLCSAVSRVILLSRRCDRWTVGNLGGNSDVAGSVCTCTRRSHKCTCQPSDVSVCVCVCVGACVQMNVWARRVPLEAGCRFHIPSPPIISRPDKTGVCWRLQDQTVMSRQLCSQHTADARWLSLS